MSIIRNGFQDVDLDVPVVLPTLNLDFANSQELDPRITFTRGSIGTFVNKNGLIETAPANQPRFDYDPISGECRGLLIEESRVNLISNSNSFGSSGAYYGIISNATISPDGTLNASKIFEQINGSYKIYFDSFTPTAGQTYCISVFVKAAERKTMYFKFAEGVNYTNFTFNMITGVITGAGGSPSSPTNYGAINYGNGWWRIYLTYTFVGSSGSNAFQIFLRNDTSGSLLYQGDGSSGFYIYGKQAELGSFPTSYIPTSGSTVTRSADLADMTGTNFSSWFNQTEGTIYTQAKSIATISTSTRRFLEILASSGTERYLLGYNTTSNTRFLVTASSINQADITVTASPSAGVKMCASYSVNNFSTATNGRLGTRDIAGLVSTPNRLVLGSDAFLSTNTILSGTINRITYYPKALSPAQLQYLTQ